MLEAAGVDTVPELARRNPSNLQAKINALNSKKKLVLQLPSFEQISEWIVQAESLARVVNLLTASFPAIDCCAGYCLMPQTVIMCNTGDSLFKDGLPFLFAIEI